MRNYTHVAEVHLGHVQRTSITKNKHCPLLDHKKEEISKKMWFKIGHTNSKFHDTEVPLQFMLLVLHISLV